MSRRTYPRPRKTSDILPLFTKVATTNHFEMFFQSIPSKLLGYIQSKEPLISRYFITRELGLLCKGANLPGTAFATAQVNGNYMGITQKYAHTRIYTDSSFTFIVDKEYKVISFFELWQEFIASSSNVSATDSAYYIRMEYPSEYKCDTMRLQKFDKDHFRNIEYTFINAFPVNITPVAVSYENNRVLEISVTFSYDRYFYGNISSLSNSQDNQLSEFSQTFTGQDSPGNEGYPKSYGDIYSGSTEYPSNTFDPNAPSVLPFDPNRKFPDPRPYPRPEQQ